MTLPLAGLLRYGALSLLGVLCIGPIAVMVLTSFKTQAQTFTTGLSFFFLPTLENYRDVLFDASFGRDLVNSLIVGVVATLITLLLGCMAAYGNSYVLPPATTVNACFRLSKETRRIFTACLLPATRAGA